MQDCHPKALFPRKIDKVCLCVCVCVCVCVLTHF